MKKICIDKNGVKEVDMTADEIAVREQDAINQKAKIDELANQEKLKASAKAKLVAGEPLTEAEADTLVI